MPKRKSKKSQELCAQSLSPISQQLLLAMTNSNSQSKRSTLQAPISFHPQIKRLGWVDSYDLDELENAPRFHNAGYYYALEKGSPILVNLLKEISQYPDVQELLTDKDLECRILFNAHHLHVGEYPDIPGWRAELLPGIDYPDPYLTHLEPYKKARTVRVVLSEDPGGVSTPILSDSSITFLPGDRRFLWNELNLALAAKEPTEPIQSRLLLDREVVLYSNTTLVRESAAHASGWRMDLRLMFNQFDTVAQDRMIWTSQVYVLPKIRALLPTTEAV
jgi:hypothetical protein